MSRHAGTNLSDVKNQNTSLILKLIATQEKVSRANLSRRTGLTKTTSSKIVSDLMSEGVICEQDKIPPEERTIGRQPTYLDIGPESPCVCGMLIQRQLCTVIFADYKGRILQQEQYAYEALKSGDELVERLMALYDRMREQSSRKVVAVGIASIGPVDIAARKLLTPANFYGITNYPIADKIQQRTGLSTFLISDSTAGAVAEKVYGTLDHPENFMYLHIMNGIGAGFVFHNQVYTGDIGQSGEIGHTSINFGGPTCSCGQPGCLEMYANDQMMNATITHLRSVMELPSVLPQGDNLSWVEIITAAAQNDGYAVAALNEFSEYLAHAVTNVITLLDIQHIVLGYNAPTIQGIDHPTTLEKILEAKLQKRFAKNVQQAIRVRKTDFGSLAPLVGSAAVVTNLMFQGKMNYLTGELY